MTVTSDCVDLKLDCFAALKKSKHDPHFFINRLILELDLAWWKVKMMGSKLVPTHFPEKYLFTLVFNMSRI